MDSEDPLHKKSAVKGTIPSWLVSQLTTVIKEKVIGTF